MRIKKQERNRNFQTCIKLLTVLFFSVCLVSCVITNFPLLLSFDGVGTGPVWDDVAPIIRNKCTVCHNPSGSGPMDFLSYEDVSGRRKMISYVIENNLMPPWSADPSTGPFKEDLRLTPKEKTAILKWLKREEKIKTAEFNGENAEKHKPDIFRAGAKQTIQGSEQPNPNPMECVYQYLTYNSDLPDFPADWTLTLPETPVIPADQFTGYKRFLVQTNWTEDKWIKDMQFNLKPKVIHHFSIFIMTPSFKPGKTLNFRTDQTLDIISALRSNRTLCGSEIGIKVPARASIGIEVHYEPVGRKMVDDFTNVQVKFHERKPKYKRARLDLYNTKILIPPYESSYQIQSSFKTEKDLTVVKLFPHMHLRGKAAVMSVVNPRGKRKKVLAVNPWNFNFQPTYTFLNPLKVEKGSTLECRFWYDNSSENPANPDPEKHIKHGLSTTDEMAYCGFILRTPSDSDTKNLWIDFN